MTRFTQTLLKEYLHYNPDTGLWVWIKSYSNRVKAGQPAGNLHDGGSGWCVRIGFCGRNYKAHRLAYFYMKGEWPPRQLDHVNRNSLDNRWENLRLASHSENRCNQLESMVNTSGQKGVCWHKQARKWMARITKDFTNVYLGLFDSYEEACAAYKAASVQLHGEFSIYKDALNVQV